MVRLKFYFDHFHDDLVYIQSQNLVFAVPANVILTKGIDHQAGTQATTKLYKIYSRLFVYQWLWILFLRSDAIF